MNYTLKTSRPDRKQHTMGSLWMYSEVKHKAGDFKKYLKNQGYNEGEIEYIEKYIKRMKAKDNTANPGRVI